MNCKTQISEKEKTTYIKILKKHCLKLIGNEKLKLEQIEDTIKRAIRPFQSLEWLKEEKECFKVDESKGGVEDKGEGCIIF